MGKAGLEVMPTGNEITANQATTATRPGFRSRLSRYVFWMALTAIGLVEVGIGLSIVRWCSGKFLYTLDDTYIALAVSDQIHNGHYGLNAGEPSAPCSSILYPFLEAPASGTPLHPYLPLILNTLAMLATVVMMQGFSNYLQLAQDKFGVVVQGIALVLFAVGFSLIAIIFTGLEHSLHIAVTAACIYGLALFLDSGKMPMWLPAMIVFAPLLRYEGLALSTGAILVLALRKRWLAATGSLAAIVLTVGGFSVFLVSLKLPPLPSSVLVKSPVAAASLGGSKLDALRPVLRNVRDMAADPVGLILLVVGVAVAVQCFKELPAKPWRWSSRGLMSLMFLFMVGGHAIAGRFGWFNRYEIYLIVGAVLICIYLLQLTIRNSLLNRNGRLLWVSAAAVIFLLITSRYFVGDLQIPLVAQIVYDRQYQMGRFVNDFYHGPVAIGDLGLVSYKNPNYVLDLGGLSSEEARLLYLNHGDARAYDALVKSKGVNLVILSEETIHTWALDSLNWTKLATLGNADGPLNDVDQGIGFYVVNGENANGVRAELKAFSATLPPRVKLTIYDTAPKDTGYDH